jgi:formylglycine-generating enzyme required for sulfatase activity/tRNA A-37 threonylcarbamoyl transferase component Bud32
MTFPTISSFKDALRIAEHSLRELNHLRPVEGANDDLYFSSGNFAVVFKMRDSRNGRLKALKCFTRDQERRRESLEWVSIYLDRVESPFILPYKYFRNELWAENEDREVLLMDWAEGETLGEHVRRLCTYQNKNKLKSLCAKFVQMALWLLDQPWAHGDLKHDNIIVRPDGSLVLVDYDGCFIPGMDGQRSRELGSPSFQHPKRTAHHFDRHIDDFSILVIFLSLQILIADTSIFSENATGENLVLGNTDIFNPPASVILGEFRQRGNRFLKSSIALLDLAVEMPPGKVIGLLEVLKEFEKTEMAVFLEVQKYDLPETMVFIQGGTFIMGDVMGDYENDEELPLHEVTLDSFYMCKYAVTFEEYDTYCDETGIKKPDDNRWGRGKNPAINVSWYDAISYCNWLSIREGFEEVYTIKKDLVTANWYAKGYRLPTEAEWEYAARGGGKNTRFGNGKDSAHPDEINFDCSSPEVALSQAAERKYSIEGTYRMRTVPVGSFAPNHLGLYEMSGNVLEWCWDWCDEYSPIAQNNPKGVENGSVRVMRGGSWSHCAVHCRSASRHSDHPDFRYHDQGFRLVFTP